MDTFLKQNKKIRKNLFDTYSIENNIRDTVVVEKDFWVCWILKVISDTPEFRDNFIFKGGTSLSKVYDLINRFSEDIDLVISRNYLDLNYTTKHPDKEKKKIQKACIKKIQERILPLFSEQISNKFKNISKEKFNWKLEIDKKDEQSILFYYPAFYSHEYIQPAVKLEFGSLSISYPCNFRTAKPYIRNKLDTFFNANKIKAVNDNISINTIDIERTFWDKMTILHKVANPDLIRIPKRYSRHYYDVSMFIKNYDYSKALSKPGLLEETVKNNIRFFNYKYFPFRNAEIGYLELIPSQEKIDFLKKDYEDMKDMFSDNIPEFNEIIQTIRSFEKIVNNKI